MSEIIYKGPFKEHIKNHVELKRAVGYKYDTDGKVKGVASSFLTWGKLKGSRLHS